MNDPINDIGMAGLTLSVLAIGLTLAIGARELQRRRRQHDWDSAFENHLLAVEDQALALNEVVDEIREMDRKRNHYRHNIHCPKCGRFSRQAMDWPTGVSDCGLHGIALRTTTYTGAIPVIVQSPDVLVAEVTIDAVFALTEPLPAPIPLLIEERELESIS